MRRATNNDKLTDSDNNNSFIGYNLGADFTSEHEWGIKDIRATFQMKDKKNGIDRRTATVFPEKSIFFKKGKKHSILICDNSMEYGWGTSKYLDSDDFAKGLEEGNLGNLELTIYNSKRSIEQFGEVKLATSWDSKSFGIMVTADESDNLEKVYEAIKAKNVSIWLGGGGVFQNAGLVVAIRDLLPKDGLKQMLDADKDAIRLEKADKKTGIKEKLEKAGRRYFACSPKWTNEFKDKDKETEYDVVYWLNPMEQQIHNYGWFTVEELEEWIEEKGVVMTVKECKESNA